MKGSLNVWAEYVSHFLYLSGNKLPFPFATLSLCLMFLYFPVCLSPPSGHAEDAVRQLFHEPHAGGEWRPQEESRVGGLQEVRRLIIIQNFRDVSLPHSVWSFLPLRPFSENWAGLRPPKPITKQIMIPRGEVALCCLLLFLSWLFLEVFGSFTVLLIQIPSAHFLSSPAYKTKWAGIHCHNLYCQRNANTCGCCSVFVFSFYFSMESLDRRFDQVLSLQLLDKSRALAQILQEVRWKTITSRGSLAGLHSVSLYVEFRVMEWSRRSGCEAHTSLLKVAIQANLYFHIYVLKDLYVRIMNPFRGYM